MRRSFYDDLSPEDRRVIDDAARTMIVRQRAWYRGEADSALARLREAGVEISGPDKAPFRAAARGVYEAWADRVGGMDRIEAILSVAGSDAVGSPRQP